MVVSRDLAEIATALGMPAEKIDVVYRGVDQDCFRAGNRDEARDACQIPREAIVLLWSGRLEAVKNPRMLLHAAARWQDRWGDRLRVLVAGDGSMSGEMKSFRQSFTCNRVSDSRGIFVKKSWPFVTTQPTSRF